MAEITVREFTFQVPRHGPLTKADVVLNGNMPLELDMANAMRENALAIPYRGQLLMRLVQRELALVLSLFHHAPPGQPLTRHAAYRSSSLHIRRLTTEVMALGILNAVVTDRFGPADIAHYDILPPALRARYPSGSRPDLRIAQAGQVLAGESRGRSGRQPVWVDFTAAQLKRLNELVRWSRHPSCDPVCMAWSWMEDDEIVTDFFSERVMSPSAIKRFGIETQSPDDEFPVVGDDAPEEELGDVPYFQEHAERREGEKASFIASHKRRREAELVESAPTERVPGLRQDWRGEWIQVPSIDGAPTPRVLLAVSDRPRRRKASKDSQAQKIREGRRMELEASTDGRLLFAIDWRSRPVSEVGEQLDRLIALDSDPI